MSIQGAASVTNRSSNSNSDNEYSSRNIKDEELAPILGRQDGIEIEIVSPSGKINKILIVT